VHKQARWRGGGEVLDPAGQRKSPTGVAGGWCKRGGGELGLSGERSAGRGETEGEGERRGQSENRGGDISATEPGKTIRN